MTKKIEKFWINLQKEFEIKMVLGARILFCEKQEVSGLIRCFFWCEIDSKEERKETRQFICLTDNEEFESKGGMVYRGSIMSKNGDKLYHFYERVNII